MLDPETDVCGKERPHAVSKGADRTVFRHILACLAPSPSSHAVLAHAVALASRTDARLTLIRVLEPAPGHIPADPVEWMLRHYDMEAELRELAASHTEFNADAVVIDGPPAESICDWARDNDVDLAVLGARDHGDWQTGGLGGTSRRIAETIGSSVLLVPATEMSSRPVRYRLVMTPLDGSSRSECALPVALGIADLHEAAFLLVHALPTIGLTETGPLEAEAIDLRDRLSRRNERVAEQYLRQVRSRLPNTLTSTRTRVLASEDSRHALARAATEDRTDIIVLSPTGLGRHADISVGSVADYLINHADKPILLVRGREQPSWPHIRCCGDTRTSRLPSRALK